MPSEDLNRLTELWQQSFFQLEKNVEQSLFQIDKKVAILDASVESLRKASAVAGMALSAILIYLLKLVVDLALK